MKMKELVFGDVFEAAEIAKTLKINLSEDDLAKLENDGVKAGIQIILNLVGNLKVNNADVAIEKFLGHLFGITGEEFHNLGLKDTTLVIKELTKLKKSGEMLDFLDAVGHLME